MKSIPKLEDSKIFVPYYSNSKSYSFIHNYKEKKTINPNLGNGKNLKMRIIRRNIYFPELRNLDAYEKADIESNITKHLKSKNIQNILEKDKKIKYYLTTENKEVKKEINQKKLKLKEDLTKIINDCLSLVKKSHIYKNASVDNKKLNKNNSQINIRLKNKQFLDSIGINIELYKNKKNNVSINIDKAWNYINKISNGKNNIDDILKYKIVNTILNLIGENRNNIIIRKYSYYNIKNKNQKINKKEKNNKQMNKLNNKNNNKVLIDVNPYENNRLRMIDIINKSFNNATTTGNKNESQ